MNGGALAPAGPAAARIWELFWAMTWLGGLVFLVFCLALAYALWHRRTPGEPPGPERDGRAARTIVLLGGVIPGVILIPLFVWTVRTLGALDPGSARPALVVDVTGKQWWWQIGYRDSSPARAFITANELHVPVGRRVELRLGSTDVIHSFWIPELHGKTDLIPGRENVTWIEASRPGIYGGPCAEYCGVQHANMRLIVVAEEPEAFERWAEAQRLPAVSPADSLTDAGRTAFLRSACARCHAVRGTAAGGTLGPDLTHVASRKTLAAGLLPNTFGHLGGWIANPQALKPGTRMPRVPLSPQELRLIHQYVHTLR
jgi:cytochrome c oxidase subunit 2